MKLSNILTESGFALIEVMIAAGLLGVVAVGSMQLMNNLSEGQRRTWQLIYTADLVNELQNALRSADGCFNTLGGAIIPTTGGETPIIQIRSAAPAPPAPPPPPGIGARGGTVLFQAPPATNYGTGGGQLRIVSFGLTSSTGNTQYAPKPAAVRVTYQKRTSATTWGPNLVKDISVTVVPHATGAGSVMKCYIADMSGPACDALGGSFNTSTGRCSTIDLSGQPGANLDLPSGGQVCAGGVCNSFIGVSQRCPRAGMDLRCRSVVGIAPGGRVMCGADDDGTGSTINCN